MAGPWCIKDEEGWKFPEIVSVLYQCLHALAHLHAKPNAIHRNIKPENIWLERRDRATSAKIADFGLTKEGSMFGDKVRSSSYTAPEVFSGKFIFQQASSFRHSLLGRKTDPEARSPGSSP